MGDARLREIDALLSAGGLDRSRPLRVQPESHAGQPSSGRGVSTPEGRRKQRPERRKNVRRKNVLQNDTRQAEPVVLRIPEWSQYPWLAHGFSTRTGGVSRAYSGGSGRGELNLGQTPSDSPQNVLQNRDIYMRALLGGSNRLSDGQATRARLALLRQIHSGLILAWRSEKRETQDAPGKTPAGDGWITAEPNVMLGIQTADCLPILVADTRQRVVAAFHAGWRGTLARIAERGVGRMRAEFGSHPEDLTAAVGPGIGSCCYAVGEEVRMEFDSQFAYAPDLFREVFDLDPIRRKYPMLFLTARAPGHSDLGPEIHLDLAEANRRQLLDAGVRPEAVHVAGFCTACHPDRFFSHRAERGFTGRMINAIGVRKE